MKVELRVARCRGRGRPKSKKLIKLKVDAGNGPAHDPCRIAEAYKPEELVGRTIVIVANLKPRPMMVMESQGRFWRRAPRRDLITVAVDPSLPAARAYGDSTHTVIRGR